MTPATSNALNWIRHHIDFDLLKSFEQGGFEVDEKELVFFGVVYVDYESGEFVVVTLTILFPNAEN